MGKDHHEAGAMDKKSARFMGIRAIKLAFLSLVWNLWKLSHAGGYFFGAIAGEEYSSLALGSYPTLWYLLPVIMLSSLFVSVRPPRSESSKAFSTGELISNFSYFFFMVVFAPNLSLNFQVMFYIFAFGSLIMGTFSIFQITSDREFE